MAGDKDSDAVDKIKAGLKGMFSRKKKSKGSEPPSATSTQSKPEPSSTEIEDEGASGSRNTDQQNTALSEPMVATKEPSAQSDLSSGFREIPKVKPIEGMSATSGPLDNFEFMPQSKPEPGPPSENKKEVHTQPEATEAAAEVTDEVSHREDALTKTETSQPAPPDDNLRQEERPQVSE